MEQPGLVVYDLDGVITRKDTFSALVMSRLVRSPLRMIRSLSAAALLLSERKALASRRIAEIALSGMADDSYTELAERLGRQFAADAQWIRCDTVQRIRRQHEQGSRIVIATATERRLAHALLTAVDIPYDLLSASLLAATDSGLKVADHRVGARKVEALRELGEPIEEAEFVTDSLTDLPTALAAARVVLVGASERTRRRFGERGVRIHDAS
ncbi:hypothetical protein GCM10010974_16770 [Brevibacterium sediminis]|uniref:Haloacid dehalogenase-like hydrolase n=1 Tax=Brevibacterium sediminis TaxID=1857024 RepID=A0ABQ1M5X8_9MICO|nr:haloacid dehalogenase-like hydrolase [Brevibacterium sediminis]GGC34983.1 hypothetical protein GCM10010974_16770 [Brevibacterium sediminis]